MAGARRSARSARRRGRPLLPLLAVAFVPLDLILPALLAQVTANLQGLAPLLFALPVVQWGVLAIWGVLGPGPWYRRWPLSLAVMLAGTAAFELGTLLLPRGPIGVASLTGILHVLCLMPGLYLAAQLPLWPLRFFWGFRFVARPHGQVPEGIARLPAGGTAGLSSSAQSGSDVGPGQFGIGQLLGAVTVTAVVMASTRAAMVLEGNVSLESWQHSSWALLVALLFGLLALLPCVWAGTIAANRQTAISALLAYAATLLSLAGSLIAFYAGRANLIVFGGLFAVFSLIVAAAILGGLQLIRMCGYELQREERRNYGLGIGNWEWPTNRTTHHR